MVRVCKEDVPARCPIDSDLSPAGPVRRALQPVGSSCRSGCPQDRGTHRRVGLWSLAFLTCVAAAALGSGLAVGQVPTAWPGPPPVLLWPVPAREQTNTTQHAFLQKTSE